MQRKEDISGELQQLGVDISAIPMPLMSVPEGYFKSNAENILAKVASHEFISLLPAGMPNAVPENYFNSLEGKIREKMTSDSYIEKLPKMVPFAVPQSYFEELSAKMSQLVQTDSFLSSLPKELPYSAPSVYFDPLTESILQKTVKAKQLSPLRATRSFYGKMWIAASLFLILSAGFLIMNQKGPKSFETELAQVSDTEIESYMKDHAYEFDNHITYQAIDESKIDINKLESDIYNAYFDDITDEEINNFL